MLYLINCMLQSEILTTSSSSSDMTYWTLSVHKSMFQFEYVTYWAWFCTSMDPEIIMVTFSLVFNITSEYKSLPWKPNHIFFNSLYSKGFGARVRMAITWGQRDQHRYQTTLFPNACPNTYTHHSHRFPITQSYLSSTMQINDAYKDQELLTVPCSY